MMLKTLFGSASAKEEKKLQILTKLVERNKIKNSGASIDDVIKAVSNYMVIYHLY
jgi:hypothetical protein